MICTALTPPMRATVAKLIVDELRTLMAASRARWGTGPHASHAILVQDNVDLQHALLQLVGIVGGDEIEIQLAELFAWKCEHNAYMPSGQRLLAFIDARLKTQALNDAARPVRAPNVNPPAPAVRPPVPPGRVVRECHTPHRPPLVDDHKRAAAGDRDD